MIKTTHKIKKEAEKFSRTGDSSFDFVGSAVDMAFLLERAESLIYSRKIFSEEYYKKWLNDFKDFQKEKMK